jgi:hypothetical protein
MTTRQEALDALQWANETLDGLDAGQRVVGAAGLQTAERLLVDAAIAIDARNYTDAVTLAHSGQVLAIEVTN